MELKTRKNIKIKDFGTPIWVPMPRRYYVHGIGIRIYAKKLKFRDSKIEEFSPVTYVRAPTSHRYYIAP